VLLIHRNARPDDPHLGKYNGLGGKLESGEDVLTGLRREVREEAGIECDQVRLSGTISWPGFGKHGEDWFGFIFRIDRFSGTPLSTNPEGTLEWVDLERVVSLPLWEGRPILPPAGVRPQTPAISWGDAVPGWPAVELGVQYGFP
jgi:8-oxo-dGTP diphosphatase